MNQDKITDAVNYLFNLVEPLCAEADQLKITPQEEATGLVLIVSVSTKDKHLLIGKDGITAYALRQLMSVYNKRHNSCFNVSVV